MPMTALARAERNLIVRCPDSLNAETAPDKLIASFLTPQTHFYIRSHGPTPKLADGHRVVLDGLLDRPRSFTIAELQAVFPIRTITATMQCAAIVERIFKPWRKRRTAVGRGRYRQPLTMA